MRYLARHQYESGGLKRPSVSSLVEKVIEAVCDDLGIPSADDLQVSRGIRQKVVTYEAESDTDPYVARSGDIAGALLELRIAGALQGVIRVTKFEDGREVDAGHYLRRDAIALIDADARRKAGER